PTLPLPTLPSPIGPHPDQTPNSLITTLPTIPSTYLTILNAPVLPLLLTPLISSIPNLRHLSLSIYLPPLLFT
ncbi:hypothetical protein, partial [Kocuria rhizophila]|uniref:hypothetical protein n=1 Tax=Kocuria rhizophila TaxID=72000 RepID=UPI0036F30664